MAIIWCFLRSRLQDRGLSGGRGQRAEQRRQQPGLPPQAAEEEGHQILHRTAVWQEGERQDGTYGTQTRHARSTRWAVKSVPEDNGSRQHWCQYADRSDNV